MPVNKPVIVLAVLAALLALLAYAGSGGRDAAGAPDATSAPAPVPAAGVEHAGRSPVLATVRVAGTVDRREVSAAPAVRAPAADLRDAFERADDLFVFLRSLAPGIAAGDPESLWMASRVYDYCAAYAMDPAGFGRDSEVLGRMRLAAAASMSGARERMSRRCRQFAPRDGLGRDLVILQRLEAAEAGSLAAEASLLAMGEPLDEGEGYRRNLVNRVQVSRDAEAFSALAPAMGIAASGDAAHVGQVAGTPLSELAWQLAACGLGLDCGPDSSLMTAYCANGGVCSKDRNQDFETFVYDAAIPGQGEDAVDEMVDSLLSGGVPR